MKQSFDEERIFQPVEFENKILRNIDAIQAGEKSDVMEENHRLQEVILELMRKNERLMIENVQLKAKLPLIDK